MKINSKKIIALIIFLLILTLLIIWIACFCLIKNPLPEKQEKKQVEELKQNYCLADDEVASYEIKKNPTGGGIAEIFIKGKK